jgi:hypothetical protein
VELDKDVAGDQTNVLAPLTVKVVEEPEQMPVLLLVVRVGVALTVMATVRAAVHPADEVPVIV